MSNTRTLTVRQIVTLNAALPALDGHVEPVTIDDQKTGQKLTVTKSVPYRFGSDGKGGKLRWNLTKSRAIIQAEYDTFVKARDALINEISGGVGSIEPTDTEALVKLNKATNELLDTSVEVSGLLDISLSDLNLDDNPDLTPNVLAPLMLLIKE